MNILRPLILTAGFLLLWQLLVTLTGAPPYILPGPLPVGHALIDKFPLLLSHLGTTLAEILLGLALGTILGTSAALAMILSPLLKRWMLPVLVVSQAIPVLPWLRSWCCGWATAWPPRWAWRY